MLKLTIHSVGKGRDALSGKESDGLTLSFKKGKERFLSWESFQQYVNMELKDNDAPETPLSDEK